MLNTITENQEKRIINNVVKAVRNIEVLNKQGYDFLYLASGFIAHYDINGFKYNYSVESLKNDILGNKAINQYNNFRTGEENYEYYMQKKKIYNAICDQINTNVKLTF